MSAEITKLLEPVGAQFRRDLGIVCESHHLNDLGDLQKYKVSQPYGNSDAETVNLQYCAVLLRTADLLHITSDRTPSIEFRTVNPSDPISQQEWAKQMAVKRVRPKWGVNEEGQLEESAPRDTVEVHAYFTKEDGFFGLTSYLGYAAEQLKKSNEWISQTLKQRLSTHEFPWRRIDDSNIETEGFIRDGFEFTIDQAKILDLLTGHTLYNDTNIVLRELVQNAIDAIRLKFFPESPIDVGRVIINWNSKTRILSVQDNGTGMTQGIINNFLLKVGSSRYQDPEFIKNNPNFSSISRFGIGVLSTFMIADSVEIISCHPDEDQARRLMLRSVHGKYLIRLLEKGSGDAQVIGPHGSIFRLHVRPSIEISDVLQTSQHWIVVPDCKVTVQVDDDEPQIIGYSSPAEALRGFLNSTGFDFYENSDDVVGSNRLRIRIVEREVDGVTVAYALLWNQWFKEWSFLSTDILPNIMDDEDEEQPLLLGTCVEGIRIVTDTPGFMGYPLVAIANVRGQNAPKTNVARSGLEVTPERDTMLRVIYGMYAQHVISELLELTSKQSFSLTWAAGETSYLLDPLLGGRRHEILPLSPKLLRDALQNIQCVLVEESGKRKAMSPKELFETKEFWTIDCALLTSAEYLIREVASAASLSELVNALNVTDYKFPNAPVVCGDRGQNELINAVFEKKEVDQIIVNPTLRRVDLRWVDKSAPSRWCQLPEKYQRISMDFITSQGRRSPANRNARYLPQVPNDGVAADVPSSEIAVNAFQQTYLIPGSEIATFARRCIEIDQSQFSNTSALVAIAVLDQIAHLLERGQAPTDVESIRKSMRTYDGLADHLRAPSRIEDSFDFAEFSSIVMRTSWKLYDNSVWNRITWS